VAGSIACALAASPFFHGGVRQPFPAECSNRGCAASPRNRRARKRKSARLSLNGRRQNAGAPRARRSFSKRIDEIGRHPCGAGAGMGRKQSTRSFPAEVKRTRRASVDGSEHGSARPGRGRVAKGARKRSAVPTQASCLRLRLASPVARAIAGAKDFPRGQPARPPARTDASGRNSVLPPRGHSCRDSPGGTFLGIIKYDPDPGANCFSSADTIGFFRSP